MTPGSTVGSSFMPRLVTGGIPDAATSSFFVMPGTTVRICAPALNPSLRFHSCGSTGLPATLRGIARTLRSRRRPVADDGSYFVNQSFGDGRGDCAPVIGGPAAGVGGGAPGR